MKTDPPDMDEAIRRADWLHERKAPASWIIITLSEIGEFRQAIADLNQRLIERQESFQAQLIRIEEIWRGKLAESRKDADRLYNCLIEAQFGESLDIAYVQNVLAQHEELAAIG
jgi:hypothetical protein